MTPELKTDVIKKLKDLGKKVAMVGDDANDLGAIKEVKFFFYLSYFKGRFRTIYEFE